MTLELTDIKRRYSVSGGGIAEGNVFEGTRDTSLGGYLSITAIPDNSAANGFPDVDEVDSESGVTWYRCWFIYNASEADTLVNASAWIASDTADGGVYAIGLDPVGVVDADDTDPQSAIIANQTTAPAGVTFSAPTTRETGLEVGDLGPGECFAIWCRYTVPSNATPVTSPGDVGDIHVAGSRL